jgi:hypothetical protein
MNNRTQKPNADSRFDVDEMISRFNSPEQKRIALRKALNSRPDDTYLKKGIAQLTNIQEVRRCATQGMFISYTRADELFAFNLMETLSGQGLRAWLDMTDVDEEEEWHVAVRNALKRSGLMLAVMSPNALKDPAVNAEREFFAEQGKLVLPVIYKKCDMAGTRYWLMPIDFSHDFDLGIYTLSLLLNDAYAKK